FLAQHLLELEFFQRFSSGELLAVEFFFACITGFVKFVEHFKVIQLLGDFAICVRPDFFGPDVFQDGFRLLGVIPKIRLM
ncbi:MAG: hypothetical protein HYR67_00260, partial [Bacteroidetes bacterium]|nr:hypothetical protein [Bacteroidota bacterium]